MLFKVYMAEHFVDCADRCGVIEANHIGEATLKLTNWKVEDAESGAYELVGIPTVHIEASKDFAAINWEVKDEDGHSGCDTYYIKPVEGDDILMFLAQDWNLVFN